ncbi:MAG: DUF342 domain-containing protein [Candidatus Glassbacteria bacterium]|nr:DUF342 domain-containing protein [Candidatus Glassbacteria bacterium]
MAEEWRKIKVSLRNTETEAYIMVPFLTGEGTLDKALTIADARMALASAGVKTGIKDDVLNKIFEEALFDQELLIAEAVPVVHGLDAKLEFYFDHEKDFKPREDKDGRIDYKDISFLNNVSKGDQLCRRHPPTPGEPGSTATGTPIEPKPGKDRKLPSGKNTEVSVNDPDLLIASTGGSVTYNRQSGYVEVQPNLEIKGDVDFNTGNIDFNGSLVVTGDIKAGFKVKVTGDLEIGGCVEDAQVEAEGDILIKKGFIGRGNGLVRSSANVTVKYVQGQKVICDGDLTLGGELMHSDVRVQGNVYVNSRKGAIIGGSVMAQGSVESTQVGSETYTHTEIAVGHDYKLAARIEEITKELEQITQNQEKLKKALYNLSRMKMQLKGDLPPEQEALFGRMQETVKCLPDQKSELEDEKKRIDAEIEKHRVAFVQVKRSLYPGVKITIGKFQRVFNERLDGKTFREIKGEIIPTV